MATGPTTPSSSTISTRTQSSTRTCASTDSCHDASSASSIPGKRNVTGTRERGCSRRATLEAARARPTHRRSSRGRAAGEAPAAPPLRGPPEPRPLGRSATGGPCSSGPSTSPDATSSGVSADPEGPALTGGCASSRYAVTSSAGCSSSSQACLRPRRRRHRPRHPGVTERGPPPLQDHGTLEAGRGSRSSTIRTPRAPPRAGEEHGEGRSPGSRCGGAGVGPRAPTAEPTRRLAARRR